MEKHFIPSELAVKLKALGFEEECFAHYPLGHYDVVSNKLFIQYNNEVYGDYNKNSLIDGATAPLWQQAFDWFSDQYCLHSYLDLDKTGKWFVVIRSFADLIDDDHKIILSGFTNKADAQQIRLEKLIELVS